MVLTYQSTAYKWVKMALVDTKGYYLGTLGSTPRLFIALKEFALKNPAFMSIDFIDVILSLMRSST